MSNTIKLVLLAGVLAFTAACAQQEEPAPMPEPVMEEAPMSKY